MLTRRRLITAVGATTAAAIYPVAVETQWLEHTVTSVKLQIEHRIRLLHLSDFHASWAVPMALIRRAIDLGLESNPDVICLTGDFITHRYDFDSGDLARVLSRLSSSRPTFAVLGNHDGGIWASEHNGSPDHSVVERVLHDAEITLLHNRSETLNVNGVHLTIAGVGDLWANELDAHSAFQSVQRQGPVLVLSHNPDSKDELIRFDWDLMLSGHTHGGQVMIPFEGPRYAPVRDKRFVKGLHPWQDRQIFISRGVGSLGSVRFMCRPEVSVLDLAGV